MGQIPTVPSRRRRTEGRRQSLAYTEKAVCIMASGVGIQTAMEGLSALGEAGGSMIRGKLCPVFLYVSAPRIWGAVFISLGRRQTHET